MRSGRWFSICIIEILRKVRGVAELRTLVKDHGRKIGLNLNTEQRVYRSPVWVQATTRGTQSYLISANILLQWNLCDRVPPSIFRNYDHSHIIIPISTHPLRSRTLSPMLCKARSAIPVPSGMHNYKKSWFFFQGHDGHTEDGESSSSFSVWTRLKASDQFQIIDVGWFRLETQRRNNGAGEWTVESRAPEAEMTLKFEFTGTHAT